MSPSLAARSELVWARPAPPARPPPPPPAAPPAASSGPITLYLQGPQGNGAALATEAVETHKAKAASDHMLHGLQGKAVSHWCSAAATNCRIISWTIALVWPCMQPGWRQCDAIEHGYSTRLKDTRGPNRKAKQRPSVSRVVSVRCYRKRPLHPAQDCAIRNCTCTCRRIEQHGSAFSHAFAVAGTTSSSMYRPSTSSHLRFTPTLIGWPKRQWFQVVRDKKALLSGNPRQKGRGGRQSNGHCELTAGRRPPRPTA